MRSVCLLMAGMLLALPAAEARMHAPYRGHRIVPASSAVLDGFTDPGGGIQFRKLRSAYAGNAVRLRRTTGGEQDIGFVGTDFDTAAATAFCAATTCFITTWYDQSGNARHLTQATAANQPQFIFDCNGTLPCSQATSTAQNLAFTVTVAAGAKSLSVVGRHAVKPGGCVYLAATVNQNTIYQHATSDLGIVQATTAINNAAPSLAWHSHSAVINGAASVNRVDDTEVTGTLTTVTGTGPLYFSPLAAGATCNNAEMVYWDAYALTSGERVALQQNQRDYYTPLPLDTFATPAAAYSMRKLKSSYTGPAIRLRRASDNVEADIGFLGFTGFTGAPIDVAAANAHCAATTCYFRTWYDQSGNARHLHQTTAALQPAFVGSTCWNNQPCARSTASGQGMTSAAFTPAAVLSLNAVAYQFRGAVTCQYIVAGSNNISMHDSFDIPYLYNGSGSINGSGAAFLMHAHTGVFNGAGTVLNVDGAEATGSLVGSAAAGTIGFNYAGTSGQCNQAEIVVWSGYALTAGERAALTGNQKSFWGIP